MTPKQELAFKYAKMIAYSTEETLRFTFDVAESLQHLPGVYVECGVAAGAQIIAMLAAAPKKKIYAFDSFEGIPLPSNKDDQYPGIRKITPEEQENLPDPGNQALESSGATVVSEAQFISNLMTAGVFNYLDNLETVPGWFEHTVPKFEENHIAILRLDGDLYNSTFECLKYLYPKVVNGGCVIIDDWELPGCRAACDEYFKLIGYVPKIQRVSTTAYFFKW